MARKPPSWRQRLLFPPEPGDTPERHDNVTPDPKGSQHAVQDDDTRTPASATGDARATPQDAEPAADAGTLRQGTEDPPRSLEGSALSNEAGQRPEPDRERGSGDGSQGTGGSFAFRVTAGRNRSAFPGGSDGVRSPSHVARVKASRRQPSLFDSLPQPDPAVADPEPAGPQETLQPTATITPAPAEAL